MSTNNHPAGDVRQLSPSPEALQVYQSAVGTTWVVREPSPEPGTVVLSATGEFDMETVPCLHEALADARHAGARQTVLDISHVGFGDSSFLHELLAAHFSHPRLVLAGPIPHQLRHLFVLTGTLRLFHTVRSRRSIGLA
ncbi:STAS domain-containing protein [Streptomyces pristinaespiralis]|uniref:STAS domain-containing protein n=1 Tax=Streptomyces pristinaespiralis TaxID=38300 RepID=UPI0033C45E47